MLLAWNRIRESFSPAGRHAAESPPSDLDIPSAKYCHKSGCRHAAHRSKKAARRLIRRAALVVCSGTSLCRLMPNRARGSAIDFEQARTALAAADTHGHDAPLRLAPASFLQDVAGQPRAGHAEGMTDGDRAAVDVVLVGVDAELVAGIQALAGKGLIELPDVDVIDLQPLALQQFRHRVDRPDAHLVRLAARRRPGDKAAQWLEAALFGILGFHQDPRRRAIRQLTGIAGGDVLAGAFYGLKLG